MLFLSLDLNDTKFGMKILSQEDAKALILYGQHLLARIYVMPTANGHG